MYPGVIEAFDRAIAADPAFRARPHRQGARAAGTRGGLDARASMAAANSLTGLSEREVSHVAFFDLLVRGDAERALAALLEHLNAWPRDTVVLATTAFTNGLIGNSGRAGQKRMLLELLNRLAPSYKAMIGGSRRTMAWRTRKMGSAMLAARKWIDHSRKTRETLGRRRPCTSLLRGRRYERGLQFSVGLASDLSSQWRAIQPSELASGTRPPRGW